MLLRYDFYLMLLNSENNQYLTINVQFSTKAMKK